MSLAGIAATNFLSGVFAPANPSRFAPVAQEFQQLGQDLKTGNLTKARTDLADLQNGFPAVQQDATGGTTSPNSTIQQAFQKLALDLQAGNLTGAQSDFANLQQDAPSGATHAIHHRHPRLQESGGSQGVAGVFSQLGQELQSGNIAAAQQTYAALLQDFQQSGSGVALTGNASTVTSGISVTA